MKKAICLTIGVLMLLVSANSIPVLLARFGMEDDARFAGRATVVIIELLLGVVLVMYGFRSKRDEPVTKR